MMIVMCDGSSNCSTTSAVLLQGDFIEVLSKPFVDWWMGRVSHTGKTGLFCTLMVDSRPLGEYAFI